MKIEKSVHISHNDFIILRDAILSGVIYYLEDNNYYNAKEIMRAYDNIKKGFGIDYDELEDEYNTLKNMIMEST